MIPSHPNALRHAIVELRSGIGGSEAALFALDLYKMYERFAIEKGWKWTVLTESIDEHGGISEAIIQIAGKGAYGSLRHEAGVHRVQRTPATESKGRVHTSTASVLIFPEISEEDTSFKLDMKDVKVEVMRSRGAGGQHVNRTESAVRMTYIPLNIKVSMQDSRSQHQVNNLSPRATLTISEQSKSGATSESACGCQVY